MQWRAASRLSSDLQSCVNDAGARKLRRAMVLARGAAAHGRSDSLATSLERARCWRCADTSDAAKRHALHARAKEARADSRDAEGFGGRGPLARRRRGSSSPAIYAEPAARPRFSGAARQARPERPSPCHLGLWIVHHADDLDWLKQQAVSGALNIVWSIIPIITLTSKAARRANLFTDARVDIDAEIFDTERLMIANGITPSAFFRFPDWFPTRD